MILDFEQRTHEMSAPAECIEHSTGANNSHTTDMRTATRPIPELTEKNKRNFWRKVDKEGPIHRWDFRKGRCWNWIGSKCSDGYGNFAIQKIIFGAHRVSRVLHFGEIPDGLHVLHDCDNPACVNPAHIFVGTHQNNIQDMWDKGRGPSTFKCPPEKKARGKNHGSKTKPQCVARGENCGTSILKEYQVLEIRKAFSELGMSKRKLAQMFGISRTTIKRVVERKGWRHLL